MNEQMSLFSLWMDEITRQQKKSKLLPIEYDMILPVVSLFLLRSNNSMT